MSVVNDFLFYFLIFIIYSFIGWCVEVVYVYYDEDKLVNRGFLIGPYCPIYGISSLLMIFLLTQYMDNVEVAFVMALMVCTIAEYLTSLIMEKMFNTRWWDYSNKKFNINGRICLKISIAFGLLGTLLLYVIHPFVLSIITKINPLILTIISIVLFIIFIVDLCLSFNIISKLEFSQAKINFDNTENISKKVRETLGKKSILMKRLINAFPDFRTVNLDKIKFRLKKKTKKIDKV